MRRRISALTAVFAVAVSGLLWNSAPAGAAVSNASISPSVWQPSEQAQATITFDSSSAANGSSGQLMSVEIGWGWVYQYKNPSLTPQQYAATYDGTAKSYTCATIGVVFQSAGFASAPATASDVKCEVLASSSYVGNPGQLVRLYNTGAGGFTFTATNSVTITFAAGTITAPSSGPASDTWRIIDVGGGSGITVSTTVPAVDSEGNPVPLITINIDGNGGSCTVNAVTGYQNSWAIAPNGASSGPGAGTCSKENGLWTGFNTSPDGSGLSIARGGNLHLTGGNTLYAQYIVPRTPGAPQNVKATTGWNKVDVTWEAPADAGSQPITNYLVQATPGGRVCITRMTDVNMLTCTFTNLEPGTDYTFKVQALNGSGWGPFSEESNQTTPSLVVLDGINRKKVTRLFIFDDGSVVNAEGRTFGLAPGTLLMPQVKIGATGDWRDQPGGQPKVGKDGKFTWSQKFKKSTNGQPIAVRFALGSDYSNEYSANRGQTSGRPTEPRDLAVKVVGKQLQLNWSPPKSDGGSPIVKYVVSVDGFSAQVGSKQTSTSFFIQGYWDRKKPLTFRVVAETALGVSPAAKLRASIDSLS